MFTIRPARVADVPTIQRIITESAEFGLMLPKSLSQLYENLREFRVAEVDHDTPDVNPPLEVVGCCGLSMIWADLAEVVSLAVAANFRGKGLGRRLVESVLEDAEQLGVRRVMTLTYEQQFFERLGFRVLDRGELPLKVWQDCVRCPKRDRCDEIAMIRTMENVPPAPAPPAGTVPADGRNYGVPVPLSVTRKNTLT